MEMSSGYSFGIFCLRYGAGGQVTLNPEPYILNPQPSTLNPQP